MEHVNIMGVKINFMEFGSPPAPKEDSPEGYNAEEKNEEEGHDNNRPMQVKKPKIKDEKKKDTGGKKSKDDKGPSGSEDDPG